MQGWLSGNNNQDDYITHNCGCAQAEYGKWEPQMELFQAWDTQEEEKRRVQVSVIRRLHDLARSSEAHLWSETLPLY